MNAALRVILIGGPSNVGKSTLAQALSSRLGWHAASTDRMARYPGRPWGNARPHVAEHYLSLSPDELIEDVIRHYKRLWLEIQRMIAAHASDPSAERLILEGSAVWPESVVQLRLDGVRAVWLTASNAFLQQRIYTASDFAHASDREKAIIEKFLGRAQRYNERMMQTVQHVGLPYINVEETSSLEHLVDTALHMSGMRHI
ncbi:MAG TPA: AAA family ATPase [Roseiflexaceae bacterium]|jgi:2-phosphoglycerate kinase|nr:AAA family ATPase [Roseiflexaceae bacterium]